MDTHEDTRQRLKAITDYVQDCQRRVVKGDIMDLQGLDRRVLDICQAVTRLPTGEARALEIPMQQLIAALDVLATTMRDHHSQAAGSTVSPETYIYAKSAAALVCVVSLIGVCAVLARRFGGAALGLSGGSTAAAGRRLQVVERQMLDARRQLVLVRRDDREHLLLLAPDRETVIEKDIAHAPLP